MQREKLRHSIFKTGSFVVLGAASGRLARLGPELGPPRKGMTIGVKNSPFNRGQVTCTLLASSAEDCRKAMLKLPHYGEYSYLRFENGKLVEKRKTHYEGGIEIHIKKGILGIKSSAIMNAPAIVDSLSSFRVIYLGERHDQQGIHETQFKILKALSSKGPVAVAMEMFQKPFQKVIDAYLRGRLQEKAARLTGRDSGTRGWLLAMGMGVLSHGPIYPWYPLLRELMQKGTRPALVATFLYARSIKLPWLPVMAHYFGLGYTIVLTLLMLLFSPINGWLVEKLLKEHA